MRGISKYGNRRIVDDGYVFDSVGEHRRYRELKLMEQAGEITELRVHPSWPLIVNGHNIGRYTADFSYRGKNGNLVVEDYKGVKTRDYILRRKLMQAVHGIEIREVKQ